VRLPWVAHDEAPGPYITIPQYLFNKTQQHTLLSKLKVEIEHDLLPGTSHGRAAAVYGKSFEREDGLHLHRAQMNLRTQ